MGLMDFFKKGKEEPAKPAAAPKSTQKATTPGNSDHTFLNKSEPNKAATAMPDQDIYTVKSGDSLSKIAKQHYGDANDWKRIYEANKELIGPNADLIHPGQRFVIPRK
ncbi:LysM peptidoglycan-binding domain-containing protein [Pontibacter sp. E15-1]|uniref:LysM peptidoglycan-binding domain-containing protein n=1 Tax=Pontibacter sp. E15-1 TaxID=2919918 RepID=UPI001F500669|nr:LysM peptidoglycan-binding domain-containing protein [Pontibacter sp. E15-1]MCJ8166951.1 LysM peptidoglycan-binding domain-containing protein [Pontibacter sp. E15-1]